MRIAEIAPPWFTVPPAGYGGIELVVAQLTDHLVERGHEVTLYASGGSSTKAVLVTPLLDAPDPALVGNSWYDAYHAGSSYLDIGNDVDVVHDHSGIAGPTLGALRRGHPPVVHTLHGAWTEPSRRLYQLLADHVHLVAISAAQRAEFPEIRYAGVVHNGVDIDSYPFAETKDDFLVYIGRSNPDKGPTIAIEVARRAGLPLAMVVKRTEPFERAYWDEIVAPLLHDEVEVYEGISHEHKVDLLGRARAMLFPIQWPEPFGLVMVEAMACGTPVVACPAGAAVELVEEGVTGYLRDSIDGLVEAVGMVDGCSPAACRERVALHFSAEAMVNAYERIYAAVAVP
ncbi:MAG TPA: glycosyltransferase family 4 protein [Acidimicrobiia bacterium]|nr:glycosyltransferase family 4 protein [Acidimicrobiia bacterium]